jgi:tellurite resistance protein
MTSPVDRDPVNGAATPRPGRVVPPRIIRISTDSLGADRPITRIPPGFFGAALGLSGLAGLWLFAATSIGVSPLVGDAIALIAGGVWCALAAGYLRQGAHQILADFRDTADGAMLAAPVMSALVLGSVLSAHARTAGHVVVIVFLILGALLCGLLIGQWMTGGIDEDRLGPALYLPGGGIGFVGCEAAYAIRLNGVAALFFGIGVCTWVFASSIILSRLQYRPRLSAALTPTLAIELAPPAVAGTAYFLLHPGRPDLFAYGIAGYAVMMVIAQGRLLPLYRAAGFTAGFWSFTFPWAAMATLALRWLALEHPAGQRVYAWVVIALTTVLVIAVAARTIVDIAAGHSLYSTLRGSHAVTRDA